MDVNIHLLRQDVLRRVNYAFPVHVASPFKYIFTPHLFCSFTPLLQLFSPPLFLILSRFPLCLCVRLSPPLCRERRTVFSENVTLGARDTVNWHDCTPPVATPSEWLRTTTLAQGTVATYEMHKHPNPNPDSSETIVPCTYTFLTAFHMTTWQSPHNVMGGLKAHF